MVCYLLLGPRVVRVRTCCHPNPNPKSNPNPNPNPNQVCDANLDAPLVCRALLLPMAPLLAPGAGLVLTLKLPRRCSAARVAAIAADCELLLRPAFEAVRVEHLFANTGNERTLLARRK